MLIHKVVGVLLMLKRSYSKSGGGLSKTNFDEWAKLALHRLFWDLGEWVPRVHPILDPKVFSKCLGWQ